MGQLKSKLAEQASDFGRKAFVVVTASSPMFALAQTATTPESAIGEGETKVLAILAIAGAAMIAIALAGVGWGVGVKFIKRLRGAA